MSESITFNEDCIAGMKRYPDGFFSLAVVDPPYGSGADDETEHRNQRGRFDRYNNHALDRSQSLNVERERERERRTGDRRITDLETQEAYSSGTSVTRTGGTWAEKYGKKS